MERTAVDASAGLQRIQNFVPKIHTTLVALLDQLDTEFRLEQELRSAFLSDAQALGAPLHSDRLEDVSRREALLEELRRRGADLAAVLMRWCQPYTALDQPIALPVVEPLGRFIYDMIRTREFIRAQEAQRSPQEASEEEPAVADTIIH
jgi:hypothetical protein